MVIIVAVLIGTLIKTIEQEITPTIVPTITPISSHIIPQNKQSEIWIIKPNSIYDGDTLRVINGAEELKVRFCGIDAPEKDQPLGIESRDHLRSLIDQGDGTVYLIRIDNFHGIIARTNSTLKNLETIQTKGASWTTTPTNGSINTPASLP